MRNSLIFKLMGVFLLVIAVGGAITWWLASQATRSAFNLYSTRSGQVVAQNLAPSLADYYSTNGSWQGVETLLQSGGVAAGQGSGMMGHGQGAGRGSGALANPNSMGSMMAAGQRLILADASGLVISDTLGELIGSHLTASDLANGASVTVSGSLVGTLLVTPNALNGSDTLTGQFLSSVNQSILISAAVAGIIALLLGFGLFLQITAPLRQLKKAAAAIAGGDLHQRVSIQSKDELGELGRTFNHMAEALDQSQASRQRLVADVAHELRTPLAVMQANLEGMIDGVLPLDMEQINAVHTESMLLNRLVGDLRLLSLAESGELKLERGPADLGKLILRVCERIQPQAKARSIHLEAQAPTGLPQVDMDTDRITQVLNNLIHNALVYTPAGGEINVQARLDAAKPGMITVTVTDTGPGIPAADLQYIFDRFYRVDRARARNNGGSGLGLAIVKQLVEAHGGEVGVESPVAQDHGTQFWFTLPGK